MKHFKITLLTITIGTLLGPLVSATWIGVMSGKPFIIFYSGVIAVAYILGGPIAFLCSLVAVWLGIKMLHASVEPPPLFMWLKRFCVAGGIVGAFSFSVTALGSEPSGVIGILSEISYTVPNGFVAGLLCGIVLAFVWRGYAQTVR